MDLSYANLEVAAYAGNSIAQVLAKGASKTLNPDDPAIKQTLLGGDRSLTR
jgi:hypothetical protein